MAIVYNAARAILHSGAPSNGTSEVQTVTLANVTGGTYRLVIDGIQTGDITWSATTNTHIANVDAALEAHPSIGSGGCVVADSTLSGGNGAYTVTFGGNRAKQPVGVMSAVTSSLTGSSPTVTPAVTTAGVAATHRGAPKGQKLVNTANGIEFVNRGTALAPDWRTSGVTSYTISPAVGATTAVHAAHTDTGEQVVLTTGITNPDYPRNITATAGGTATDVKAISVIVAGTDIDGNAITETLPAFTVNTTGTVTGSKAFKTVTSITIPAHDGTGATTAIGTGAKLGLPIKMHRNGVIRAHFGGVVEGTAPTVAFSATALESNTATLNSTLDGSEVIIDLHDA